MTDDEMIALGYILEKRFDEGFDAHRPYTLWRKGNARWVRVYDIGKLTENGHRICASEL
jgi:hypothetical protein